MIPLLVAFGLGLLAGANGVGLLALVIHRRTFERLRSEQRSRLMEVRRRSYAAKYEDRRLLERKARKEGA
jgi:hypothetical protein